MAASLSMSTSFRASSRQLMEERKVNNVKKNGEKNENVEVKELSTGKKINPEEGSSQERSSGSKASKRSKQTTTAHIAELAKAAKRKLEKSTTSGNSSPWIVPRLYEFKIPDDNFQYPYYLNCAGRLFVTFEDANSSRVSFIINIITVVVLAISCVQYVVQSLPSVRYQPSSCQHPVCNNDLDLCPGRVVCEPISPEWFNTLETACVIVFTVDYVIRVATVAFVPARLAGVIPINLSLQEEDENDPEYEIIQRYRDPEYEELWWVTIYRYCLQPLNIIDLVAIIPFYIELGADGGGSLSIIRILRLARVVRLAKSGKSRFTKGLKILSNTLITSAPMNAFLLAVALIIFVVCGAIAYLIEGGEFKVSEEFPDGAYMRTDLLGNHLEPTPFQSVLHGVYWSVVTSTTVGYGDLYATTAGGRVFSCACTFLGIVVIAMPVTVLGTHFSMEYEREYIDSASSQISQKATEVPPSLSFGIENSFDLSGENEGSMQTSHSFVSLARLSKTNNIPELSPQIQRAEANIVRLEAMASELQRCILDIRGELNLHKEIIRNANKAALATAPNTVSMMSMDKSEIEAVEDVVRRNTGGSLSNDESASI